ncbi:MAG: SpoIIE family protein phosphatase [Bacteroidetes bacterium]|nr:SpoIIE family protein phosphatase [Bacteroidota bacterium]
MNLRKLLIVLSLVTGITSLAQTLNLNQFGIEDGLPQSSIYTMLQDYNGNIWFGTMAGVSKYNGLRFENFSKKDSLAEYRVTSSCLDKAGNIWFGHWNGGISKYSPASLKFHPVNTGNFVISSTITSIVLDNNGTLWFATSEHGLISYTPTADELQKVSDTETGTFKLIDKKAGLPSNKINNLSVDVYGAIYIATGNGLVKTIDGKKFETIYNLPSSLITAVLSDSKGNLWVGTEDKGITRIHLSNKEVKTYTTSDGGLSFNHVKTIIEDVDKNIFIGTFGGGVSKYLPALEANKYQGPLFQTISTAQGLSNDKVMSILQDRERNIWIGTYLNLNQYFDEQFEIFGEREKIKNSLVWSVIQAKNGKYWIGTEGGLVEFTKNDHSSKNTFINRTGGNGTTTNTTSLLEDAKGNIWYTNYTTGVSRFNPTNNNTTNYTISNGLCNNEVNGISNDRDGNIWFATNNGAGKFNINTEKFESYTTKEGLGSNKIFTIYKDSKQNLWFGCLGGELTMYDGTSFKKFSEKEGYNNFFTLCITEDNRGNMWFGSFEKGLYRYDGKSFKNYTTKDGMTSDQSFMLVCDNLNNLWIGNNQGIDKFNLKDELFKHYGKQDGFLGVEINPNAVFKDTDGNLWFGSIIGLVKYTSKSEKNNQVEPILVLDYPRLFFNKIEIKDDHVFRYDQNHFTFDFVGASLTNPKRVTYKYMLEGHDLDWSPPQKQNYVTYSLLNPGKYTFKVKSANNDGVWNKEPASFIFTIKPPFWRTWWFWSIVGVVLIAVIIVFVQYRERKLKEQNQILEQKVLERTEELRKEKEIVELQNQNIRDSIDYAKRIQEAVFVPMETIHKNLPNSFIFFRPKDVVSGDFYWVHNKNGKIIFAMADCTGHGVPGAFMSIIGNNLLSNVVKEMGIVTPSLILDELSKQIDEMLNPNQDGRKVKDGMDIAVCAYNPITKVLEFAGAHNAMYHVRKGELKEYKADKQPVGKTMMHDASFKFNNHTINIEPGDYVFLFTDGYADAIGGPKRTKFFYPPFRKLLAENTALPLDAQQKKLEDTLNEWLGSREQVDDIAIMGVKF